MNTFERDEKGLIKGIEYKYTVDGRIDYRAMVKSEYLYTNSHDEKLAKSFKSKYGKDLSTVDIEDVKEDKYLLMTLAGYRYIAELRGFTSAIPQVVSVSYDSGYRCVASCTVSTTITWIGNFETNGRDITTGGVGGASLSNTTSFAQNFVETIAENRAFVRAVRNFLRIGVLGADEIGPKRTIIDPNAPPVSDTDNQNAGGVSPTAILEKKAAEVKLSFLDLQAVIVKKYTDKIKSNALSWNSFSDIPSDDVFVILGLIHKSYGK